VNIQVLFSSRDRLNILSHVVYKTESFSVSQVAKNINLSKGLASKYLNILAEEGILERRDGKFIVKDSIATRTVKLLLNLNLFDNKFFSGYEFIKSAGLYGSYAKGTNTESSDIDLWVAVEKVNDEALAKLTKDLKTTFGDVRPLYLTRDRRETLRREDSTFYKSIIFGSITMYGEEIEALQF